MSYNPYQFGPYGAPSYGYGQPSYQQPQQQQNVYAFVNGIEGAKAYPMSPNQTVMLMDNDNPIAYIKQSNGMGQATLKCYRLTETTEQEIRGKAQPSADYATRAELEALAKKIESLMPKGE